MFSWLLRHPLHTGVLAGLAVAVGFGFFSFPREAEIQKTITDWRPPNSAEEQDTIDDLIAALQQARDSETDLRDVSEEEFRNLGLARTHAFAPEARDDAGFLIRYVGQGQAGAQDVYLAERTVQPAPWWHPDRLLYRAASYEVDRFSDGLHLTFERDWEGLGGVLILDAIVGWAYGTIIGLVLAVLGARELAVPGASREKRPPPEAPLSAFRRGEL